MVFSRFAPSPTGLLHVGNVRTALVNWLYTRSQNGTFLLRFDDTDKERSREEYVEGIQRDLQWLGITWDKTARQSERMERYNQIVEEMKKAGRLYPCYETAEELDFKRKMQLGRGQPPIYDRAALKLSDAEKKRLEAEGKKPHWRFLMDDSAIRWEDQVRGLITFEGRNLGDPILLREDGTPTYMLPSAIDDVDMGITHIVRGEDHITNTAIQIQLFELMKAKVPTFAHLSLIKGKDEKISKRAGGFDIASLREEHIQPMVINSLLAKLGTSDSIELRDTLDQLIAEFDITKFSKAQANYDVDDMRRLNIKCIHHLSFSAVKAELNAMGAAGVDERFWLSVRQNLQSLAEISEWWTTCNEVITPVIEDAEFTQTASTLLPEGEWSEQTWPQWVEAVKNATGRKGKQLFMPIRKALTAKEHGPELQQMLPLIGRERATKRLQGKAA